jgi:hypothetical protein
MSQISSFVIDETIFASKGQRFLNYLLMLTNKLLRNLLRL